jgi:hypothetical protein
MDRARRADAERYRDRWIRETARRVYFLLAASARFEEPARFVEELRRLLDGRRGGAAGS